MQCYKCQSVEDLSLKRTLKSGNRLFICKPCRRADQNRYNQNRQPSPHSRSWSTKDWSRYAKETNSKLAQKYQDKAFIEARGLL